MYQSLRAKNCVAILEVFVAGFDILLSFSSTASCIVLSTGVHSISDRPRVPVICEAIIFLVDCISNPAFRRVRKISKSDY